MNTVDTVETNKALTEQNRQYAVTVNCLGVTIGAHVILNDGIPGKITRIFDNEFCEFTPDNCGKGFPVYLRDVEAVR